MVCISLFCVQTGIIRFYMRCKIFELIITVLFWYKSDCVINGGLLKERGCNYIFCIYLLPQLSDLCLTSFWWKRASFLQKRGKCDFFVQKSLLCRYFALSLHSETDERSRLLGLYPRCGFALPSLCLRSGSTPNSGGKVDSKWDEDALDITYLFVGWTKGVIIVYFIKFIALVQHMTDFCQIVSMSRLFETLSSRVISDPTLRNLSVSCMGLLRFSLFEAVKNQSDIA